MKTNVVMKSSDRTLFGAIVRQETKTSMLNIPDLEAISAKRNAMAGYTIKQIGEVMARPQNLERIFYILKKQNVITLDMSKFIEYVENNGITTTLKTFGSWKTTGARHTKTSWANPYIWMLLALEMSPEVYGEAVIWLSDKLIINRIEAGNMYLGLTNAIAKWNPDGNQYATLAKALNFIVFNRHEPGIRNTATANELKQLEDLEKKMVFAIEMGYIKSFDNLLSELRRIWKLKFGQFK
jgi:hypothetical protein